MPLSQRDVGADALPPPTPMLSSDFYGGYVTAVAEWDVWRGC
jgi:hypothetical protein